MRSWGEIRQFDFAVKDHIQLGKLHDGLVILPVAKITGSRFVVMHKDIRPGLHRALGQFMLDLHTEQHGYQETYHRKLSTTAVYKVPASCLSLLTIYLN